MMPGFLTYVQNGTDGYDIAKNGVVRSDGSVFFVGYTYGGWNGSLIGEVDWAGALLSANGEELWRWQVGRQRYGRG